jgi:hypothetical protein
MLPALCTASSTPDHSRWPSSTASALSPKLSAPHAKPVNALAPMSGIRPGARRVPSRKPRAANRGAAREACEVANRATPAHPSTAPAITATAALPGPTSTATASGPAIQMSSCDVASKA